MTLIGEEMTIEGVSGRVMRMKDNETVVLFDGKTNHEVKIPKMKKCLNCEIEKLESQFDGKYCTHCMEKAKEKQSIGIKACSKCKVEKPLSEFRQFSDKRYSKMCDKCRDKNSRAGTIKQSERKAKMHDTKLEEPLSKEAQKTKIEDVLVEVADMHYKKNADYGNSFDEQLDEDGLIVSKIMLNKKIRRFNQLLKSEAKVNESQEDILMDLIGYASMTLLWLRNKEVAE